jgi:hypothetical protein
MREQEKNRKAFEHRKALLLEALKSCDNQAARLEILLSEYNTVSSSNRGVHYIDNDRKNIVANMSRYLDQSYGDPSMPPAILDRFETNLLQKLESESQRFHFTDLYYRLLAEWTDGNAKPINVSETMKEDLNGSFEHVQKYSLQDLKDKFSKVVFTPLETDEVEIDAYLSLFFEGDHALSQLDMVRTSVRSFARRFKQNISPFNSYVLKSSIQALLTNDLLNDNAKVTLTKFSSDEVVLNEIADVLNLRFSDIDNWSWEAEEGMYYEPRKQTNGKYRIMMDQDILQALFLHYIAVPWCAELKRLFRNLLQSRFWKGTNEMSEEDKARYRFFTGEKPSAANGVLNKQWRLFQDTFFLSSLPKLLDSGDLYDETKPNEKLADETKSPRGIRQLLLRQIASDVIIRRSLHGSVAVVQSDLQWYATGLPHSTLWAVLRFWGVPEDWIRFFKKFAEAPLRMSATPSEDVRVRKRGIPITDAFEKLFGECVLFAMDVAVNQTSHMTLIRFHDDLWLCGEPAQTAKAWAAIEQFVKVLGLEINTSKTGSVYITDGEKDPSLELNFQKAKCAWACCSSPTKANGASTRNKCLPTSGSYASSLESAEASFPGLGCGMPAWERSSRTCSARLPTASAKRISTPY